MQNIFLNLPYPTTDRNQRDNMMRFHATHFLVAHKIENGFFWFDTNTVLNIKCLLPQTSPVVVDAH